MAVPERVSLKVDAQVMLVKNVDEHLVNGTVGRVLGFFTIHQCISNVGTTLATSPALDRQDSAAGLKLPKLKSVSDMASKLSISRSKKKNRAIRHVQLSPDGRSPKFSGSHISPEGISSRGASRNQERFPLIEFRTQVGTEAVLVMRDEFRVEDNEGKLLARRVQIPLVLAWAMSIHKSQGQTIEYVKIDLGSVFEKGELDFALCSLGVSGD